VFPAAAVVGVFYPVLLYACKAGNIFQFFHQQFKSGQGGSVSRNDGATWSGINKYF
jgi:hypothetical protein